MSIREDLKAAIERYDQAMEQGTVSEEQAHSLFEEADMLVPNAMLSDIVFYSERSLDEIVEEALYREDLWKSGGDRAVLLHARDQARAVIGDSTTSIAGKASAERLLHSIERELADQADRLN